MPVQEIQLTWETLFTSCNVISFPPVILYTIPVADSIEEPIRGASVACSAASCARFLLEDTPTPSIAVPEFFMTAFTSAKSTLTSPGICKVGKGQLYHYYPWSCKVYLTLKSKKLTVMMSDIPCTPWRRTSSARRNASWRGVCSSTTSNNLSFGITIRVSTLFCNFSIASKAWKLPKHQESHWKGLQSSTI